MIEESHPMPAGNDHAKTNPVWLNMSQAELDRAYQQSNYAANLEEVIARYESGSEAARQRLGEPEAYQYGRKAIETLYVFPAPGANAPIVIFIHGGAWRSGSAADYAFPAPLFTEAGAHWITPDFDSVLDVNGSLMPLASQVRNAVAWVYRNAERLNGDKNRIYLCGHSSGAHLAAVCMTTDWESEFDLPRDFLQGALCCSGMYDLKPVRLSSRSEYLNITDEIEQQLSPQRQLHHLHAPLLISHGTDESPEFIRQSHDFAEAIDELGKPLRYTIGIDLNHFEILETLADKTGLLGSALLSFMQRNQ